SRSGTSFALSPRLKGGLTMSLFNFASSLKRILPARSTRGQRGRSPQRASLRLEQLEDRFVPAITTTSASGLTADERFEQALYLDDLGRAGSQAELDLWLPVLKAGGQQGVAAGIQGSFEARDHLVKTWYQTYLGRAAGDTEELGWVGQLGAG